MATEGIGERLREAIQAGEFGRASVLIPEFRAQLSRELTFAANDEDRRQKLQTALDLMAESLHLARVIRAHIAAKLRNIESLSRYQSHDPGESRWSING